MCKDMKQITVYSKGACLQSIHFLFIQNKTQSQLMNESAMGEKATCCDMSFEAYQVCHHCIPEALVIWHSPLPHIPFIWYHHPKGQKPILHVCSHYKGRWVGIVVMWNMMLKSNGLMSNSYRPNKVRSFWQFQFSFTVMMSGFDRLWTDQSRYNVSNSK